MRSLTDLLPAVGSAHHEDDFLLAAAGAFAFDLLIDVRRANLRQPSSPRLSDASFFQNINPAKRTS
jgi:hypothetical protein